MPLVATMDVSKIKKMEESTSETSGVKGLIVLILCLFCLLQVFYSYSLGFVYILIFVILSGDLIPAFKVCQKVCIAILASRSDLGITFPPLSLALKSTNLSLYFNPYPAVHDNPYLCF